MSDYAKNLTLQILGNLMYMQIIYLYICSSALYALSMGEILEQLLELIWAVCG